jgi:glycosyltransferase involved in cell wall biosynthesis
VLVVHVYKDVYPPVAGGIERHIHAIRSTKGRHRHAVVVCARAPRSGSMPTPWGPEVHVAEYGRILSTPIAPGMVRALRRCDADLLHVHMPNPPGEVAALLSGRPFVVSYHADIVRQAWALPIYRPLVRRTLRAAEQVVVASKGVLLNSPLLAGTSGATVVPYGVDTESLSPGSVSASAVEALRERYGYPFVLAVGRLVYYKGFDVLIDAAAQGLEAGVVVVGDGPLREALQSRVHGLTSSKAVHLVGRIDDEALRAHFAAASAFVLPSTVRAEAFGIATAEAQAFGLPVVVTELGTGTTEAMVPGETGLVVPPGDAKALARALNHVLDEEHARKMGAAARRFAVDRLSAPRMVTSLDKVYARAFEASR